MKLLKKKKRADQFKQISTQLLCPIILCFLLQGGTLITAIDSKHDRKKSPVRESDETNEEELKMI